MNDYKQKYVDAINEATTAEVCNVIKELCCEGTVNGVRLFNGCFFCGKCNERTCEVTEVYNDRILYLEAIKLVAKTKYKRSVSRKNKITPHMRCGSTVCAQITKLLSKQKQNTVLLAMKTETENRTKHGTIATKNLRKICVLAKENRFYNIAETIEEYFSKSKAKKLNGKLGTANSENK